MAAAINNPQVQESSQVFVIVLAKLRCRPFCPSRSELLWSKNAKTWNDMDKHVELNKYICMWTHVQWQWDIWLSAKRTCLSFGNFLLRINETVTVKESCSYFDLKFCQRHRLSSAVADLPFHFMFSWRTKSLISKKKNVTDCQVTDSFIADCILFLTADRYISLTVSLRLGLVCFGPIVAQNPEEANSRTSKR